MTATLLVIAMVVVAALVLIRFFPETTKLWFNRIRTARMLVFGIGGLIFALAFISSGSPLLMFVGGLMLLYGVLWILFDDVTDTILEAIPL
ncbi:hypothetical protein [Haloarcula sp. Atlit-120R]|uniref:hypothetical protein n=1 Tax=Haloarcula sp. Atlit-120R TaxID=2282135 RepID=UPI000EF1C6F8|nr:hypothetical protein [Haloarcula sp. Atlit-120R]RLM32624.1 hypothetical protein DVK01_20335 [Haloarcula sp. Atlit-120R]